MIRNLRTRDEEEARAARRIQARKKGPVEGPVEGPPALHIGRVLAALRTALGLTQTDLARLARVKRASVSEYERAVTTPDASTLEKLLAAMRFRWSAIDLGAWFIERLLADCRISEHMEDEPAAELALVSSRAEKLRIQAAEMSLGAAKLDHLARVLREGGRTQEIAAASSSSDIDRVAAREVWERLQGLKRKEQEAGLASAPVSVQWALCEALCLESQRVCGDDPIRARLLAELALCAADRAEGEDAWRARLRGFAWAHIGNAIRVQGDLPAAERAFVSAEELWKEGKSVENELLEGGLIFALKASLRRAQRRFDEAEILLEQALALAGSSSFRVKVLLNRARLLGDLGDHRRAVGILRALNESIRPDEDGMVLFSIRQILADSLSKLGCLDEAAALLPDAHSLCLKYGGELNLFRVLWIEGRIAVGQGDASSGIATLSRVRGEFASRNLGYDTALVSLELAVSYAGQGRSDQVKTLARHMAPIFQAQDVHREALAALTLFRQAAERERVTEEFAREVLLYLRRARFEPDLRFESGTVG
jgi:transcriptional regulator with XRE-family HTH domain